LVPLLTPEMLQPRVSGNLEQPGTEQVPISQVPALAIHGEHDILGEIFRQASFTSAPEEISENLRADRPKHRAERILSRIVQKAFDSFLFA
jgi:hypothetical protein